MREAHGVQQMTMTGEVGVFTVRLLDGQKIDGVRYKEQYVKLPTQVLGFSRTDFDQLDLVEYRREERRVRRELLGG